MQYKRFGIALTGLLLVTSSVIVPLASAQTTPAPGSGEFNLQVTPSPMVLTVKPGQVSQTEMTIHNLGTSPEILKVEPRSFTFNSTTGQVQLNDTVPPDIANWISFSNPFPTIQSGQVITDTVKLNVPANSGFSYSFALLISRKSNPKPISGGRALKGALAIFALINVDRPGATRQLEVASLTTNHHLYQFLPSTFTVRFKNTGNTIVQPAGNVFIQRSSNSTKPLATLEVNPKSSYILPATERGTNVSWNDGFPSYKTEVGANGVQTSHLTWNFTQLNKLRIGKYTAKLVAVYDNGQQDVPLEAEVSFWVFPWVPVLVLLIVIAAIVYGLRRLGRKRTEKAVKKALAQAKSAPKKQ